MTEVFKFLVDSVVASYVQVFVGIIALAVAIIALYRTNKQFKANQISSELFSSTTIAQLRKIADINEMLYNNTLMLSRPKGYLRVKDFELSRDHNILKNMRFSIEIQNNGARDLKKTKYCCLFLLEDLSDHKVIMRNQHDVLKNMTCNIDTIEYKFQGKEKYLYTQVTFYDFELNMYEKLISCKYLDGEHLSIKDCNEAQISQINDYILKHTLY